MSDGQKPRVGAIEDGHRKLTKSEQLYAKYRAQARKEADEKHRQDTKAKIILGGTAIAAMNADPNFERHFVAYLAKFIRDSERKYVEKWLPPPSPSE